MTDKVYPETLSISDLFQYILMSLLVAFLIVITSSLFLNQTELDTYRPLIFLFSFLCAVPIVYIIINRDRDNYYWRLDNEYLIGRKRGSIRLNLNEVLIVHHGIEIENAIARGIVYLPAIGDLARRELGRAIYIRFKSGDYIFFNVHLLKGGDQFMDKLKSVLYEKISKEPNTLDGVNISQFKGKWNIYQRAK